MGVSGLGELFEKQELKLEELNGKTLAIDAYNSIYQFLTTIRDYQGNLLQNSKGQVTSHLIGLFYRNSTLTKLGIKPVYVFDGRPSELKKKTLQTRGLAKKQAEIKLQEALKKGDFLEVKKQSDRTAIIDEDVISSSKKLLELSGIPFIQALEEGESQCAYLEKNKLVDGVRTQD
ncbi:Flap endonuclease 1 [uncultured archaeon]|nr:Flap endonuclease 1 [uncultured archaeon]